MEDHEFKTSIGKLFNTEPERPSGRETWVMPASPDNRTDLGIFYNMMKSLQD